MGGPRRTLVVGDVHGCLAELDELLRTAGHAPGRDRLPLPRGPRPPLPHDALVGLARLPRVIFLGGGWVAVHAGFVPGLPLAAQPADWTLRLRYVDATGAPVPRARGDAREPGVRPRAAAWTGPESGV